MDIIMKSPEQISVDYTIKESGAVGKEEEKPNPAPTEPENTILTKSGILRLLIILFIILYALISYLHAPLLTCLGNFLIIDHKPEKSDLIVCLAGNNIERGLASADAYKKGLAPYVFMARELLPDGYELLEKKGVDYPDNIDLMIMLLKKSGVPGKAILTSEERATSTIHEAGIIKELVTGRNMNSIIVLTSPTHTRRAWLTFRKVFKGTDVRIIMMASPYSGFRPETWWKERKYVRDVIIEYQKLVFYMIKYIL